MYTIAALCSYYAAQKLNCITSFFPAYSTLNAKLRACNHNPLPHNWRGHSSHPLHLWLYCSHLLPENWGLNIFLFCELMCCVLHVQAWCMRGYVFCFFQVTRLKIETNQFAAAFRKRNKSLPEDSREGSAESDDIITAGPRALSSEPDTKYYSKQDIDAPEQASAHSPSGKFYIIAVYTLHYNNFNICPISCIRWTFVCQLFCRGRHIHNSPSEHTSSIHQWWWWWSYVYVLATTLMNLHTFDRLCFNHSTTVALVALSILWTLVTAALHSHPNAVVDSINRVCGAVLLYWTLIQWLILIPWVLNQTASVLDSSVTSSHYNTVAQY